VAARDEKCLHLLRAPVRVLAPEFDEAQDRLAADPARLARPPAPIFQAQFSLGLEAVDPLVAAIAADAEVLAQLHDVRVRSGRSENKLFSQVHGSVRFPRHRPALQVSPMSCPLSVTDVLYHSKVCPHPDPLPADRERVTFRRALLEIRSPRHAKRGEG